ncbi:MAG: histone deacetylase family protein [Syntrophales bacterium]|jgi:acetoin utilization deacetylase AcuC-like enzyme
MKVIYHEDFSESYTSDPAAAPGRMEAIIHSIKGHVTFVRAAAASEEDIAAVHAKTHIERVRSAGLYEISALAAGGAIQAAQIGLTEPGFGLIRPPGHHASAGASWGFCYFNNMAIALEKLKREKKIEQAFILDFDLHFGDGTVNILEDRGYVTIYNPSTSDREEYLHNVEKKLAAQPVDIIGISAGFDNHKEDWGGVLATQDYREMGQMVRETAERNKAGYFAILEGGYNHRVLGKNVMALIEGMEKVS